MQLQDLRHTRRELPGGGEVFVLDTGALIGAESEAMLQALHSRSVGGFLSHLEKLQKSGSEKFMSTFYVGYGHKSIGDCGSTTLFIEGVSMLAAKAIQDFMLYNGQEASTRYIDFATQPFIGPAKIGSPILEEWRRFYLRGLERMQAELVQRRPRTEGEKEDVYAKAVKARSFDIMRGFLPAGASTNLAWHGELRHISDHLDRLRHHPLAEVRSVAEALEDALAEKYPSSFQKKRYEITEHYVDFWMGNEYYFNDPPPNFPTFKGVTLERSEFDFELVRQYDAVLSARPPMTDLPKFLAECGTGRFSYTLDFGSFRDNQRHRAVIQRMPLLTADYGFSDWYYSQMPEDLRDEGRALVETQVRRIEKLSLSKEECQYYLPMGMLVSCRLTGDLPALVYLVERRARLDVHPTMRKIAQDIGTLLQHQFGSYGLSLHMETEGDRFYYKRGEQDIVERSVNA
jgi:thymidylate synthase ThyX